MAIFLLGAATAYTVSVVPDIGTEAARDAGLMQRLFDTKWALINSIPQN